MVADALSRPPEPTAAAADHAAAAARTMEDNPIDFQAMATEQKSCAETQKLISGPTAFNHFFSDSRQPQASRRHIHRGMAAAGTSRSPSPLGPKTAQSASLWYFFYFIVPIRYKKEVVQKFRYSYLKTI